MGEGVGAGVGDGVGAGVGGAGHFKDFGVNVTLHINHELLLLAQVTHLKA